MKNANIPAYPGPIYSVDRDGSQVRVCHGNGLTKREQLAASAMQGILSGYEYEGSIWFSGVAVSAVKCADALLAELEKPQ